MATQGNKPATGYPAAGQPNYAMGPGAYNAGYAQPYPAYQPPAPGPYNNRFGSGRPFFRRVIALVITLAVIVGIAILITWLVLRPHRPKFYVESANISQLNVTGDRLDSKMEFNITIRNSNKKLGIFYDDFVAKAFYDSRMIAYNQVDRFYQGHKSTKAISFPLASSDILLEDRAASDLPRDLASKSVGMLIRLDAWIRFKVGAWSTRHYSMEVYCDVMIDWNGTSGGLSHPTRCDVDI